MRVTLKDVAEKSGYSYATVSRVIANQDNVSEKARRRILNVLEELDYGGFESKKAPEPAQRTADPSRTVLVICENIENPFYDQQITCVLTSLRREGYHVILGPTKDSEEEEVYYIRYGIEQNVAGMVFITISDTEQIRSLLRQVQCPVILLNRYIRSMEYDAVIIDNYHGGYTAGKYLTELQHTDIFHVAGPALSTASSDRTSGFADALHDAGVKFDEDDIFYGSLDMQSGMVAARVFLEKPRHYTAVFCGNLLMGRGFYEVLIEEHVNVPEDVSMICFDEDFGMQGMGPVRFTVIGRDSSAMGAMAAKLLLERMKGERSEICKIIYAPQMTENNSCKMQLKPILKND